MFATVYIMNRGIFLLLGSNQGDRLENLDLAKKAIGRHIGRILKNSGIYKTAAWGKTDQPDFYNQVVEIDTALSPLNLLDQILFIEHILGRVRTEKWGPRIIDIDLLFYGNTILNQPTLTVPHPSIASRKFTLAPLAEIASEFLHPQLHKNMKTLLEECADILNVEKINN
jgi:2-amino-4-hydroxy-6-hydroxymethyldihydropteridine diphosphokinase